MSTLGAGNIPGAGGRAFNSTDVLDIRELERRRDELDGGRRGGGIAEGGSLDIGEGIADESENTCESDGRDFDFI